MAIAERASPRTILAAGLSGIVATLLLTIPAAGLADVGLVAAGVAMAAGTAWAWTESRRLQSLPLELSRVAGTGVIDGVVVYRFRARLGRGRAFRDARAQILWEPEGGPPIELPSGSLPPVACGPVTLIVRDAELRVRPPGSFRVRLRVVSAGRTWEAEALVPSSSIAAGRFDGIAMTGGRLAFEEGWDALRPE